MSSSILGIIGGSGLYDLPGLSDTRWVAVDAPLGAPSGQIFMGRLGGAKLAFYRATAVATASRPAR